MDAEILKSDDDRVMNECPDDAPSALSDACPAESGDATAIDSSKVRPANPSDACPADAAVDAAEADADQKEPSFVVRPNGKLRPNKGKIRGKYPTCLLR